MKWLIKQNGQSHAYVSILGIPEFMRKTVDQMYMGLAQFMDLKKAFDTFDHSILLKKLNAYGFRGKFNDLNSNYLTNRQQYVENTKGRSSKKPIECGMRGAPGICSWSIFFSYYISMILTKT